ncbi:MAG: hypothetical protein GXP51_00890 [Deltaproteobacteria bacterium]|nr:hypothetical protein [Deltaproteobacteria bacterium]
MDPIVAEAVSCQQQINSFFVNQRSTLLLKQSNRVKQCGIAPTVITTVIMITAKLGLLIIAGWKN